MCRLGNHRDLGEPDLRSGRMLQPEVLHVDSLFTDLGEQTGELARTIGSLGAVQSARVHLVLPEKSDDELKELMRNMREHKPYDPREDME